MKPEKTPNSQTILCEKNTTGDITLPDFKIYRKLQYGTGRYSSLTSIHTMGRLSQPAPCLCQCFQRSFSYILITIQEVEMIPIAFKVNCDHLHLGSRLT